MGSWVRGKTSTPGDIRVVQALTVSSLTEAPTTDLAWNQLSREMPLVHRMSHQVSVQTSKHLAEVTFQ